MTDLGLKDAYAQRELLVPFAPALRFGDLGHATWESGEGKCWLALEERGVQVHDRIICGLSDGEGAELLYDCGPWQGAPTGEQMVKLGMRYLHEAITEINWYRLPQ